MDSYNILFRYARKFYIDIQEKNDDIWQECLGKGRLAMVNPDKSTSARGWTTGALFVETTGIRISLR
jgi:hypothetical protein